MKKYITYIAILIAGVFLGWLLFGGSSNGKAAHNHTTEEKGKMWTCSMHPQIMQPEPGDCPICGMDLIPAEAGAEGLAANQFKLTKNAMALANVQTTVIGNAISADNTITLSGKIAENEKSNAVQVSYFAGRIERLNVNFTGEKIRKGQLLATVYSPELVKAQQELLTAASVKENQPALYNAVRNKLKLWKLSENQINQIEKTGKVKENFPVYATVSGTVSEKLVEQGDYVSQGQALLKIANLNSVWANFDVYENKISNFKVGQDISITTNAYPNETFKAKVSFINPVLNQETRTVTMRAVLNNSKGKFKPAMFVTGKVEATEKQTKEQLSIPATAVLWTGKRSVVYVKPDESKPVFEMREVVLGGKAGDNYQVEKGLKSGEEIVTNGIFTIDASAQLQGKKSMMNHTKEIIESFSTPKAFKEQLQKAYDGYIGLKDALVKTDANAAKTSAENLQKELTLVDMKLLTNEEAHKQWMQLIPALKSSNIEIAKTTDVDTQRKYFKVLSEHFIVAVQSFGINEVAYKQYCPMADSDKGAYWLSKEKQVLNPYFGDMMLKCGEVKETINNN
ncbi:efflux transporter periplasmic adaptor subunit [Tenacibaculum discolor]|uniref:Efflux RND transporter periplasmic adaptor subunit n=1 Tax=Tenacibaculum discolor TaxID=361581 RepID=A0A2G1BUA5_9FLAO|nr:efflux RND transporter periplasmic adaptor subunit [Tenacibaculum discolor]MDP2542431.1 efflux RND transporter periplasmic adaptor subunit [Tenacibaculum discolor]PHN97185.1 efflux transporter periplasmic adaptor subunit [Tenacibaculum discolor]